MTQAQFAILAILVASVAMFVWGRWRHDVVAMGSLICCVLAGLVPSADAFSGFGHPAVITVACVLVLSRGLLLTGAVDALAQRVLPASGGPTRAIVALTTLGAVLSAFMNNVGALALLMPIAMQAAARHKLRPGQVLMPLAFGSILGGTTTLIGTPPNMIVAGFRAETAGDSFTMFDFTPVGLALAVVGVVFVALVGRRLVPVRERAGVESFETGAYLTEVRITEGSEVVGKTMNEVAKILAKVDAQVVGLIRNELRVARPNPASLLHAGEILVVEAEPEGLAAVLSTLGATLEEDVRDKPEAEEGANSPDGDDRPDSPDSPDSDDSAGSPGNPGKNDKKEAVPAAAAAAPATETSPTEETVDLGDLVLTELAVLPSSTLIGRSASDIHLRTRFGINLLAISRQGHRSIRRLRSAWIHAGDVLLMQGPREAQSAFAAEFGAVPLAKREIHIPDRRRAGLAVGLMAAAIGAAAFGLLSAPIAFGTAVLLFVALRVVPPRGVYDAIDWPVIVLLGALFPVAGAMETTGAADLVARVLLAFVAQGSPVVGLTIILIVTMTLSDFMNNAATAAVMCPIAVSTAAQLGSGPDAFLMAVAIGASCAFLTPIGHQNNTLILGPGGFKFGDYWRLGLPLEILIVLVGVPTLLRVWPL